ncbi:hypothetical protein ACLOJK_015306 [Asimina triloba]
MVGIHGIHYYCRMVDGVLVGGRCCREDHASCFARSKIVADQIDFCGALAVHDRMVLIDSAADEGMPVSDFGGPWTRHCQSMLGLRDLELEAAVHDGGVPLVIDAEEEEDAIDLLYCHDGCSAAGDGFVILVDAVVVGCTPLLAVVDEEEEGGAGREEEDDVSNPTVMLASSCGQDGSMMMASL